MLRLAIFIAVGLIATDPAAGQPLWPVEFDELGAVGGRQLCGTISLPPRHDAQVSREDLNEFWRADESRYGRLQLVQVQPDLDLGWVNELDLVMNGHALLRFPRGGAEFAVAYSLGDMEIYHVIGAWSESGHSDSPAWSAFFRINARGEWCMTAPFRNYSWVDDPFPQLGRDGHVTVHQGIRLGMSHYVHYDGRRISTERRWVNPRDRVPMHVCREMFDAYIALTIQDSTYRCVDSPPAPRASLTNRELGDYSFSLRPIPGTSDLRRISLLAIDPRIRGLALARLIYANCRRQPAVDVATFSRLVCGW